MDRNEQDWDRLGNELRGYQPAGDPEADFAAFRELQREEALPRRRWLAFFGLGLALLLAGSAWLLLPPGGGGFIATEQLLVDTQEMAPSAAGQSAVRTNPTPVPAATPAPTPAPQEREVSPAATPPKFPVNASSSTSAATPVRKETSPSISGQQPFDAHVTGLSDAAMEQEPAPSFVTPKPQVIEKKRAIAKIQVARVSTVIAPRPTRTYQLAAPPEPEPTPTAIADASLIDAKPVIVFGTGLSSHWRGSRFMEDVDNGVYFSVGLEKRFGRFSLDGRAGYRGHGLDLVVDEGAVNPWSHYEDKTNAIDDSGEEIEYTYVGIVEGYKGLEFSLLAGYQLNHRLRLQAGGRYSLPSLNFRRSVHSSHNVDVTDQPNPYHLFVTQQPLVRYRDYGALIGGQYRLGKAVSIEAMLHLGMVDLIEDEGERMQRFNHSSSVSLGIRYRLQ